MAENPYRAPELPIATTSKRRDFRVLGEVLLAVLFLGGGIGTVTGQALATGDFRLGLAVVAILIGFALLRFAEIGAERRRRRSSAPEA